MKDEELDFIKRAVDDANGFGFIYGKAPFENMMATVICEGHQYIIREKVFQYIIYPHLIQSAIDGIKLTGVYGIGISYIHHENIWYYSITDGPASLTEGKTLHSSHTSNTFKTALEAKEAVLKYLYKQESNNGS